MKTFKWKSLTAFCVCLLLVTLVTSVTGYIKGEKIADVSSHLSKAINERVQSVNNELTKHNGIKVCPLLQKTQAVNKGTVMLQDFCDGVYTYDVEDLMDPWLPVVGNITIFGQTLRLSSSQDLKVDVQYGVLFYQDFNGQISPRNLSVGAILGLSEIGFMVDYEMDLVINVETPKIVKGQGIAFFDLKNPVSALALNFFMDEKYLRLDTYNYLFRFEVEKVQLYFTGLHDNNGVALNTSDSFLTNFYLNKILLDSKLRPGHISVEQLILAYTSLDSSKPSETEELLYPVLLPQANVLFSAFKASPTDLVDKLLEYGRFENAAKPFQKNVYEEQRAIGTRTFHEQSTQESISFTEFGDRLKVALFAVLGLGILVSAFAVFYFKGCSRNYAEVPARNA